MTLGLNLTRFHWDHVSLGLRRLGLGWKAGVEDGFLMRDKEFGVFPLSIDGSKLGSTRQPGFMEAMLNAFQLV